MSSPLTVVIFGASGDLTARKLIPALFSLSLKGQVALGAALQALQDVVPGLHCYVREYGILITLDEAAPPDGLPLIDFWHQQPEAGRPKSPGKQ